MSKEHDNDHDHECNNDNGKDKGGQVVDEERPAISLAATSKSESVSVSRSSPPPPLPPPPPPQQEQEQELLWHRKFPYPSSLLQERSLKRARQDALQQLAPLHVDPPLHVGGLDVPTKTIGACGTCGLAEEDPNNTIVLCDGEGCGQEFHIQCCTPPLLAVPKGAFYCIDCCDKGTTKQLQDYLVQHAQRKDDHEHLFWMKHSKKRKGIPAIFADALLMEDVIKESKETDPSEPDKNQETNNNNNTSNKKSKQQHRSQTGRSPTTTGQYPHTPDESPAVPCSELEPYYGDRYQDLIGKPVRMYCPIGNNYHNGRILQAHKYNETNQISYLVRFPRGKDQRKISLTLWMNLEEHSLAVATDILWVSFGSDPETTTNTTKKKSTGTSNSSTGSTKQGKNTPRWTQAKLWRRNARELVPVADSLLAEKHQIAYRHIGPRLDNPDKPTNTSTEPPSVSSSSSSSPTIQWGLFESFGPPGFYQLLEFATSTKAENPLVAMPRPGQSNMAMSKGEQTKNAIVQGLVDVERNEQKRVLQWNSLALDRPWHVHALQCQDEMTLGSLLYQTPISKNCFPTTALVDDGLDRLMILELVAENLKLTPTKDLSMDMVCEIVESLPSTVQSFAVHDVETTKLGGKL